jgi:hypothetical protein
MLKPVSDGGLSVISARLARVAGACMIFAGFAPPAEAQSIVDYRHIVLDGQRVKWGEPVAGQGAVVSYALTSRARSFPGARNCKAIVPVEGLLSRSDIAPGAFDAELRAAFALWTAAANITFVAAADDADADILIGAQHEPRGRAFTNVEYGEAGSAAGLRPLRRALICLNPEEPWKIGFDGNLDIYDLRYTLLHEIGHAIGLDHPEIDNQLMDFRYSERFRMPQPGDVRGAVALYGAPPGDDGDGVAATAPLPAEERTETGRLGLGG